MDRLADGDSLLGFAQWWAMQSGGEKVVWVVVAFAAVVAAVVFLDRLK